MAVSHDQPQVGPQRRKLAAHFLRDFLGLQHREPARLRPRFDPVGLHFLPPPDRPIRLGEHRHNLAQSGAGTDQPLQQRQCDHVGTKEDKAERRHVGLV